MTPRSMLSQRSGQGRRTTPMVDSGEETELYHSRSLVRCRIVGRHVVRWISDRHRRLWGRGAGGGDIPRRVRSRRHRLRALCGTSTARGRAVAPADRARGAAGAAARTTGAVARKQNPRARGQDGRRPQRARSLVFDLAPGGARARDPARRAVRSAASAAEGIARTAGDRDGNPRRRPRARTRRHHRQGWAAIRPRSIWSS